MLNIHLNLLNLSRFSIPQIFFRNITSSDSLLLQKVQYYKSKRITNKTSTQEELILNSIKANKVPSIADWLIIKQNVLSSGKDINEVTIDAQTLGLCIKEKNYEAGKSFIKSIQSEGKELNLAALGKFMRLYYVCNELNENKKDETFILNLFNEFKKKYPVIAAITAENIIHAISITKEWRQCLILLEAIKSTVQPSIHAYSVIAAAAFNNNDQDLGWNIIEEMISVERYPLPVVYHTWLNKSINSKHNLYDMAETLLKFFSENEILPTKDVVDKCIKIIQTQKYFARYTKITKKGVCQCCKKSLEKVEINENEFNELKDVFIDNVIIGKNVFTKTTPDELKKFQTFIEDAGPCDIVIDGLNVAYSAGNKKNNNFYAKLLANVVRHYRVKSYKIIIIGREHMYKWPKSLMDYVNSNSKLFLAQNLSEDDPYVLYATMSSGLGTKFLSRDLMRGHLYLLMKPNLKRIFRKWQQLHQFSVQYVENSGQVHIRPPFPFSYSTQVSKNGWHVPYTDSFTNYPINSLDPPMNWLCLQRNI